jgi:hypothetical protein
VLKTALVYSVKSYPQFEYSPINFLAKCLSFRLSFRSTRILRQIVIITPLSLVYYRLPWWSADYTMNGPQSDTYNIMNHLQIQTFLADSECPTTHPPKPNPRISFRKRGLVPAFLSQITVWHCAPADYTTASPVPFFENWWDHTNIETVQHTDYTP